MIRSVKRKLRKFKRYRRAMAPASFRKCMMDYILGRQVLRSLQINGVTVLARTNSRDIDVALSSLFDLEYSNINAVSPDLIVDAGANIGTSTIYFARKYPNAKIIAIEPEESNFKILKENVSEFPNVTTLKGALWGKKEVRNILDRHTGHWGFTVADTSNIADETGQQVDCFTLESIMENHQIKSLDILKMDIEGGEKSVLENSSGWIDRVSILTVELHDRIVWGCDRAFYLATANFARFEKHGEKITAYRK